MLRTHPWSAPTPAPHRFLDLLSALVTIFPPPPTHHAAVKFEKVAIKGAKAKNQASSTLKKVDDKKIGKRKSATSSSSRVVKKGKDNDPSRPKRPPTTFFAFVDDLRFFCCQVPFFSLKMEVTRSRTRGLSVSLASPDGRVIAGGVAGMLMAAGPIQVVVGSFLSNSQKEFTRSPNPEPSMPMPPASGVSGGPTNAMPISRSFDTADAAASKVNWAN